MSKIVRYAGNLRAFGSNAQGLERTLFGETTQADDLTSQVTAAFLRGWGIVGPSENPSLEDFNAAMYAMSQFIAYQHQMGIPEWDAAQEYYKGSLCVRGGETYSSLVDDNIGSAPPSVKWTPVLTAKNGIENLRLLEVMSGVVGQARNARMSVAAALVTATFTADSLVVEDSGGRQYRLNNFNSVINLTKTGAGGMDSGAVPSSGFIALYAIYNPVSNVAALLAVNATSEAVPEIYGGANMPAGYTASALVSVWPVAASKFIIGFQQGRKVDVQMISAMIVNTINNAYTSFSISSVVPVNAKAWSGAINVAGTGSVVGIVAADSGGTDAARVASSAAGTAISTSAPFRDVSIITPQTAFYFFIASGSSSINIFMSGYIF